MKAPRPWSATQKQICSLLSNPARCRILQALLQQEWLPIAYLARISRLSRTATSQHVAVMKKLRVVEMGIGRLYRLNPVLRPPAGADCFDFGWLRLPVVPPTSSVVTVSLALAGPETPTG